MPIASTSRRMAIRQLEVPRKAGPRPSIMACTHQSCHRKPCRRRVPKSAMLQPGSSLQPADLLPHPRHGARVEHLQLELAEALGDGAAVQLHQHGERRDLPHGGLDPGALEGQLVLVAVALQVVGREAEALEPLDELGREHLPLAVEHVAAQPGGFAAAERQRADVVELLFQLADVDEPRRACTDARAVNDAEGDAHVAMAAEDRLRHQQLVEVGIQHRADDRVDLPGVVVDAGGDVGHALARTRFSWPRAAPAR